MNGTCAHQFIIKINKNEFGCLKCKDRLEVVNGKTLIAGNTSRPYFVDGKVFAIKKDGCRIIPKYHSKWDGIFVYDEYCRSGLSVDRLAKRLNMPRRTVRAILSKMGETK